MRLQDDADFDISDEDMPPPPPPEGNFPTQQLGSGEVADPPAVTPGGNPGDNPLIDIPAPVTSTIIGRVPPPNYAVTLTRRP
eukprot:2700213-Amphidinium_carterae.1